MLTELKLMPLNRRRILHLLQYAKWLAEDDSNLDEGKVNTRSHAQGRNNLYTIQPRNDKVKNSFYYSSTVLWNLLPKEYDIPLTNEKLKSKLLQC